MGGRSGNGNRNSNTSTQETARRTLQGLELTSAEATVNKTAFQKVGNGNWELTGPYETGAQILDETGSTRALREGFMPNQKVYSVQTWGQNPGDVRTSYHTRLNDAKAAAKEEVKEWLKSVTRPRT